MRPPIPQPRPVTTTHHGRERVDDYDWLRDTEDADVRAYFEAENTWAEHRTAGLAELRATIFEEIKNRTLQTDLSVPVRSGDYWYYARSFEGREYGSSCRVAVADPHDWTPPTVAGDPDTPDRSAAEAALPGEEVLLDLDQLADGHEFFSLGGSSITIDGNLLAYATDVVGDERYTIRVKDLRTGEELGDCITGVMGGATWDRAGESFFYSTVDDSWRPDKVWRHYLGDDQADDELMFHEPDERYWIGVGRSGTDRFMMIVIGSKITTEFRILDFDSPTQTQAFEVYCPRQDGLEYSLEHARIAGADVFLVLHNANGPDFELSTAPIAPSGPEDWSPVIGHAEATRLESVEAFERFIVVQQRSNASTQVRILDLDESGVCADHIVDFGTEVGTVGAGNNQEFDQPTIRVGFTSLAVPGSIYDYDVAARELHLRKRATVLGGFDPDEYAEHRLWAPGADGVQIPISLVRRKDSPQPAPLLLDGYGSYEISSDPGFSIPRLSLLNRGATFAIAHIRGGGELGRNWYETGKLQHKRNTFDDFIACARYLTSEGWTDAEQLVAEGGSAGGLLMGAVANQAPEAFAGICAPVPFVDNLTTMLDASLPLTVIEYDEWGNPEADADVYDYIESYAPYDNVAAVDYPPILAETSYHDTRVLAVEPAKWISRLRERATGRRDFVLKTEMAAGHGGVSGRYQAWKDRAYSLAWILEQMGRAN